MTESGTIAPSPRLLRDGRILSAVAALCLTVAVLVDALMIGAMALRSEQAGLSHGGFAFLPGLGEVAIADGADPPFTPIRHFPVLQSSLAAALLALRLLPGLVMLWSLMRLFGLYGRGEVFTNRAEGDVRTIAWALLGYAIVPLITHAALFAAQMSQTALKLEVRQLDALVAGLILLAITRVVSFGSAIDRDRRGFV